MPHTALPEVILWRKEKLSQHLINKVHNQDQDYISVGPIIKFLDIFIDIIIKTVAYLALSILLVFEKTLRWWSGFYSYIVSHNKLNITDHSLLNKFDI